jgi:hypothetical protein
VPVGGVGEEAFGFGAQFGVVVDESPADVGSAGQRRDRGWLSSVDDGLGAC